MDQFYFVLTNPEAEELLKAEIAKGYPQFKLSYSRKSFLTFKGPGATKFFPWMARISGTCLGKKTLAELEELPKAWVWKRDESYKIPEKLQTLSDNSLFKIGEVVKLIMMVGHNEFWLGEYVLSQNHFQTPGEVSSIEQRDDVPSRAYYKIAEAFEAFDLPMDAGESVLELGSAPGGASLFLLEQELKVYGVDPAEMDPAIVKNRNFIHFKKPFEFITEHNFTEEIDWIISDVNLPPTVVMKEVDRLLGFLRPRGMVVTLKLNQPRYLSVLRPILHSCKEKGFKRVALKYLPGHRQEIALVCLNDL